MAILHLAERPTVLARDARRVFPFFHKARLINHEDPIRFSHIVSNQAVINLQHPWLIPRDVADPTLHRSHATGVGLQGNRLNRLAFERAELPHHVPKEMVSRLAAPKALPEGSMKGMEFVEEPLDLTGADIELRQGIDISWGATHREHLSFSSGNLRV